MKYLATQSQTLSETISMTGPGEGLVAYHILGDVGTALIAWPLGRKIVLHVN